MARALVRSIITGVREATSVSSSTRLTPSVTPTTRPTRPFSLMTGLPGLMPASLPALARRALANGPRLSETIRADAIRIGGSVFRPSSAW